MATKPAPKTPKASRPSSKGKGTGSPTLNTPLAILASVVAGCLIFLSFPTFDIFPLSWFGVAFLVLAIRGRGFGPAFWLGLLAGFVCNLGGFYWISYMLREFAHMAEWLSWVLTALMAVVQGLIYAFSAGFAAGVTSRFAKVPMFFVFPVIFTAVEYAFPLIFPWYLANGQQKFTAIIQIADITGAAGITFLVVLVNCALADIAASRIQKTGFPIVQTVVASLLFAAAVGYGIFRIEQVDQRMAAAPKFKIGLVEANIGIWEKEAQNPDGTPLDGAGQMAMLYANLLKHQYLSRDIEKEFKPDLIVWPESSYFPLYQVYSKRTNNALLAVSSAGGLFGVGRQGVSTEDGTTKVFKDTGLSAISALNEEKMIAVGPRGAAYWFNGREWKREKTGTDRNLNAVAWSDDGEAMAVGDNGTILKRKDDGGDDGEGVWKPIETGVNQTLRGVVHAGKFGWVACGDAGTLFSIEGGKAKSLVPEGLPDLTAVAWSDSSGVVAVGHLGSIVRVTGPNEVKLEQPTKKTLRAVYAGALTWAVGDDGEAVMCDKECHRVTSGVRRTLNAVAAHRSGGAIAAGDDGVVVELRQDARPNLMKGASGRLVSMTEVPFVEGYPYPLDTKKIYVSRAPLPSEGSFKDPMPGFEADRKTSPAERNSVMRGFSTPMIFGNATQERFPAEGKVPVKHNTAMLMDGNGEVLGTYFKNRLLIFGEFIPFENLFPFLRKWLPEAGDWTPGEGPAVFTLGDAKIGISICYEGLLAGFHRKLAALGPNVMINITNDAWFGKTHEPWLHLQLAELRTVETRTPMVRSTNTGISAFVDAVGRRVAHTGIEDAEYLVRDVPLTSEKTIYVRYGDVFAWACCGLAAILVAAGFIGRRRGGRA